MKPVMQDKYLPEHGLGNCMQAAVASFFEMELKDVVDFASAYGNAQQAYAAFIEFFNSRGLGLMRLDPQRYSPRCTYFVVGRTSRGTTHMCLYNEGVLLHDPHPENSGLTYQEVMYVPVMVDVSKWILKD